MIRRIAAAVLVAPALFLFAACKQNVDLSAVAAFSKSVSEAQNSFSDLSDDFRVSCLRTVGWQRAARPSAFPDAFSACTENAKAARQWQAANSVLAAYIAAIGSLAGDDSNAGDYGLTAFASTFNKSGSTKALTGDQQSAIGGAADALVGAYFKAKRREALGPILTGANADLDTVIMTLESVAQVNYVTQLTSERIACRIFFEPNIARAKPGLETLEAFKYRAVERDAQSEIDKHQGAVDSYVAALENIRTTHANLAAAVSSKRFSDVTSIVRSFIASNQPQLAALQKAFH